MKNFSVTKDNKEYWVSRSVAAVTYLFTKINGTWCVLADKRGNGLPTNVGKWNCPSGYLDFNETIAECAAREIKEETGVEVDSKKLKLYAIDDRPTRRGMQNILFRYYGYLRNAESQKLTDEFSEPNEVDNILWIPVESIDYYDWVSNKHLNEIKECFKKVTSISGFLARLLHIL